MSGERQVAYWAVAGAALLGFIYLFSAILLPFVLGVAIAYFLDPVADLLERWHVPRWLAAALLTIGFMLAVVGFLLLLAPLLQAQIMGLIARLPDYVEALRSFAMEGLAALQARVPPEEMEKLQAAAQSVAGDTLEWFGNLLAGLWSGGLALLNLLSLVVVTPIVAFYLLRDWDRIVAHADELLPREHAETIREQMRELDRTLAGFIRGQASVCLILGVFYAIALTVIGLDFGLIVGLGTGFISFIPYFGMIVGLAVSVGLAIAQFTDPLQIALVAAVFVLGQVVEGNFVTPRLVGQRVGLHPVWMIFALFAGGALFGFLGVLLAVPVAAAIGVLVRFAVRQYRAAPLYTHTGHDRGA